jgi:hypothetical protein
MGTAVTVADLDQAVSAYSVAVASEPGAALSAELIAMRRVIDRLELTFSAAAARFAATDEYERQESLSPIDWVRHHCRMSGHGAAQRVCVGEQLKRTPLTAMAVEEGLVGFGHLALMARTSQAITDSPTGTTFDETALLEQALVSSVGRFRVLCHHARHAQDPDGHANDEVTAVEAREFHMVNGSDGMMHIRGKLDSLGGASLRTAIEALAVKTGKDDTRHKARRNADALIELSGHGLDSGVLPVRGTQRPHLQVTTSLETFLGMSGCPAAEVDFSLPISVKALERLACDSSVTSVLFGANSAISDVSRAQRSVSGATRRAVNTRDPHCCWPGCDRPANWTQAHHLKPWARGGNSALDNIIPLCLRHHWMVHEGGWKILRTDDGSIVTLPLAVHLMRELSRGPGTPFLA